MRPRFRDSGDGGGEVIVDLHGQKISGRYALIQTNGDQWLAHRMKEQPARKPSRLSPRCWPHSGSVDKLTAAQYAFEGKFDGYRLLLEVDHGSFACTPAVGGTLTGLPAICGRWRPDLAEHAVIPRRRGRRA